MANFLNKRLVGIAFPKQNNLSIVASDLAEDMLVINVNGEPVNELSGAVATIQSVNLYQRVEISVALLKTSSLYNLWLNRVQNNAIVDGGAVVTDDTETQVLLSNVNISVSEVSANGNSASASFKVRGDIKVNNEVRGV